MSAKITAAIEEEIADRLAKALAAKEAEMMRERVGLDAVRAELQRQIAALSTVKIPEFRDDDTASTDSGFNEFTDPLPDHSQLDFIFNRLRAYSFSHVWAMIQQSYNLNPSEFTVHRPAHYSGSESAPHLTIRRIFPKIGQGGVALGTDTHATCHVYFKFEKSPMIGPVRTTPRRFFTHATMEIDKKIVVIAKFPGFT